MSISKYIMVAVTLTLVLGANNSTADDWEITISDYAKCGYILFQAEDPRASRVLAMVSAAGISDAKLGAEVEKEADRLEVIGADVFLTEAVNSCDKLGIEF